MKPFPFVAIAILLLVLVPSTSAESDYGQIRITGVHPTSSFEGVELTNYGNDIDLKGYSLCDGEGTVSFTQITMLSKGESIWILKSEPAEWFDCDSYLVMGSSGITNSKFALNDNGDDIYLKKNGKIIDAFVYGNLDGGFDGWQGLPFQKISKNSFAVRISYFDTDTADDWNINVPGRTDLDETKEYDALVSPFVFPESKGYPVMNVLAEAEESIDIAIYILSQNDIVSILISQLKNGVSVRILCECNPVGGIPDSCVKALATLEDYGAIVRLISSDDDGFKRYSYLHNKYAVIDGSKVIVTSENWVDGSFLGNRGWGVIVESEEYASYMESVFDNDFDYCNTDIIDFKEAYPDQSVSIYISDYRFDYQMDYFSAIITPVVSPDNSFESMRSFISGAEERIYSEQLDVQYHWLDSMDNPLQWMIEKGSSGLDTRLMVDVTFDNPDDEIIEDGYGLIDALDGNPNITCKTVVGYYSVVHNKGVIVDDSVWIGSVNWTSNSFNNNRESAVIVRSQDVADFFTEYYLRDWGLDEDSIIPVIEIRGNLMEGGTIILDASSSKCNPGSMFLWDLDNDGIFETKGEKIMVVATAGEHDYSLMITDTLGNMKSTDGSYYVEANSQIIDFKYVPLVILCAMIIIIKAIKTFRGRCR